MRAVRKRVVSMAAVFALVFCSLWNGEAVLRVQARETTKEESVSVKTDATGSPYRVTVENTLAIGNRKGSIRDASNLKDIRNKNGDETFTTDADGNLLWENNGADILYEGDADAGDLPVAVRISYYLNGREVAPEQIAGASGRVRIRFDYENKTEGEAFVPFVFLTGALLDADVFTNVTVENGSVSRMDDLLVVTGFVFPGLRDALKLASYEKTDDIDIPDYLEIEADAEEFALEFTATMVMNGMFEDIETDGLDDMEDMLDNMDALTDATDELADGMNSMLNGAGELEDGIREYTDAAKELADGAKELSDGMAALKDNAGVLAEGANAVAVGLHVLNEGLKEVDLSALTGGNETQMQEIQAAAASVTNNAAALGTAMQGLQTQLGAFDAAALAADLTTLAGTTAATGAALSAITGQVAAMQTTIETLKQLPTPPPANEIAQLEAAMTELQTQTAAIQTALTEQGTALTGLQTKLSALPAVQTTELTNAVSGLTQGLQTLAPYLNQMAGSGEQMKKLAESMGELMDGVQQLEEGSYKLALGVSEYTKGAWQAADGAKKLADGAQEFSGAGTELQDGYRKLYDGIREASDGVQTFRTETKDAMEELDNAALTDILDALRTVQEADKAYTTFSGAANGCRSSVRFLFETDAVKR